MFVKEDPIASVPDIWASIVAPPPPAGVEDTGYPLAISFKDAPSAVGAVQVLVPTNKGISISSGAILKPGEAAATAFSTIRIKVLLGDSLTVSFQTIPASALASTTSQALSSSLGINPSSPGSTTVNVLSTVNPAPTPDSTVTSIASITSKSVEQTAAASSSASTSPQSARAKPHISTGAVAGVALGCLVAGALIAGLVLWLCCGKKRRSRAHDSETRALDLAPYSKGPLAGITPVNSGIPSANTVESGLTQPLEDKALTGEISKISNSIKNHVQSYYHNGRVNIALVDDDDLRVLGSNMPVSSATVSELLESSKNREIALRFCMAWAIITRMQGHPSGFLPIELMQCLHLASVQRYDTKAQMVLLGKWRMMTAALLQPTYVHNAFTPSDSRNDSIRATVLALDNVLQPYADSRMDNEQRRRNLEEILKRAATFAFTLFSQPGSWDFDWDQAQCGKSGELCIFPALMQITDEAGNILRPPRPFSESVMRRMDA